MQSTYFDLKCTFLKSSKREPSAQYQYFRSWCSLSGSLGTLKEVAQQAEEKRLPQKISFNCLETSPKLDKPTHFRKLQLETFLRRFSHLSPKLNEMDFTPSAAYLSKPPVPIVVILSQPSLEFETILEFSWHWPRTSIARRELANKYEKVTNRIK